jgi:hypothetical protein
MAQTKPKAGQFYGVSNNGTDGQFLKTDGTGGMSWDSPITNPTITSIDYPGSATAADPAGGESVIINGTLFASGITCTIGGTSAVTAFNSATQITITTPAKAAGQYAVAVTNPDGGTVSEVNFIQYSGVPVWSTASGNIGSVQSGSTASFQVTATEGSDTIEYAVTTGTLPSGLSLNTNTGAITGTAGSVSASTTTTFSITATDDENQTSSARSFNITVTPDFPSNHFNTVLYTGNGSTQAITGVGFAPDLIWIKARNANCDYSLTDSIRGVSKILSSNSTSAEGNQSPNGVTAFGSDGFSVTDVSSGGSSVNGAAGGSCSGNPPNYVAWNFKAGGAATNITSSSTGVSAASRSANPAAGFSIVTYTSTGDVVIPHGLDSAPKMAIVKRTDSTSDWFVYNTVASSAGRGFLNNSNAFDNSGVPTFGATDFTFQSNDPFSAGVSAVVYFFADVANYSKIDSYAGNGTTSHIIQTGFKPAFLMIKGYTDGGSWNIIDDKRNTNNPIDNVLYAEANSSEDVDSVYVKVNFLTNGFELLTNDSGINMSGRSYIYVAFAADPSTTTPSLANSFDTTLYNGSSSTPLSVNGVGFKADFSWLKVRNNSWSNGLFSSLMPFGVNDGVKNVYSNNTDAATDLWGTLTWNNTGFVLNGGSYNGSSAHDFGASPYNYVSWNWKAGGLGSINTDGTITSVVSANQAAGFSISKYNHTTTSGTFSVGHGLGAAPELVFFKCLVTSNSSWIVYYATDETKLLVLNANGAASPVTSGSSASYWSTSPSSSVFNFGTAWATNYSYYAGLSIMYSFKSITGYSKVGTYTGLGSGGPLTVNMGFAPTLGLIKRTDTTGGWRMFDTVRGTDKSLRANSNDAEYDDASNYMDFTSTGFYFSNSQTNSDINAAGGTYIYLAIKEN